jgi:LysM repeat protein
LQQSDARRDAELAAIDTQLKAQTQEQARMRQELADELSGKMAKILQTQAASSNASRSQSGYEHVVKTGQTLSEIAREYKVTSAAIIKANNLKNPNDVRVGQKLFIPE